MSDKFWIGPAGSEMLGLGSDGVPVVASDDGIEPMTFLGVGRVKPYNAEEPPASG